jgi:hypothetical protein
MQSRKILEVHLLIPCEYICVYISSTREKEDRGERREGRETEKERGGETDRQTDRDRGRDRDRERQRQGRGSSNNTLVWALP